MDRQDEEQALRAVALQNVQSINAARRRAEEELLRVQGDLRSAQERLQTVIDSLPLAVAWLGADQRYRFANPVFAAWVRRPLSAIVGSTPGEVLGPAIAATIAPSIARVLEGEQVQYERMIELPGLGERWVQITFTPTHAAHDASRRVDGFLAVGSDIHESRLAAQRMNEADRRKDEFLATLAHELRNPLAPIGSALEIMKLSPPASGRWPEARDIIERQFRQMVRLVDDLIDVARITTGKLVLRRAPADAAAIARAALEAVAPLARQQGHRISAHLPREPLYIECDATRLTQVLLNLLSNAVKFTDPGGLIELELAVEDLELVVRVRDTGIGLAPHQLESIFDMFIQGDASLDRPASGLGVGLALARRLIELHGGRISARSSGPGTGSEFEVRIPNAAAPAAATALSFSPAPARSRRILLVDDNRDFALSMADLLRALGHEVRVVHDGEAGAEAAAAFQPEIAFLDLGMPRLSGFDLAARLRRSPATARTLVVAISGYSQPADRERARQAGFDAYFVKPVPLERLRELMARVP